MTLPEFLLARIAEEEAVARAVHRYENDDATSIGLWYAEDAGHPMVGATSHRVLLECDARRRIALRHSPCDEGSTGDPCRDLRDLAAVYDEHPDYDPSWRADS